MVKTRKKHKKHIWSNEEREYLESIVEGRSYNEIALKMYERFGCKLNKNQIGGMIKRLKLKTGIDTKYKPNHSHGQVAIGSEHYSNNGYIKIKVANPSVWRMKHHLIYEQHYGEIPPGHAVIFADGNKHNFDIDNLLLVKKGELSVLNKFKLKKDNAELTKVGLNIARIIIKTNELKRK